MMLVRNGLDLPYLPYNRATRRPGEATTDEDEDATREDDGDGPGGIGGHEDSLGSLAPTSGSQSQTRSRIIGGSQRLCGPLYSSSRLPQSMNPFVNPISHPSAIDGRTPLTSSY
eukprot:GHVU01156964.1.p1 GENE.GHVU01156964.1~~GHVU01156964.1.p1  ORF type:complete len:114 (-),score=7.56 GHVU01156964.1:259-600(-)